MTRLACFIAITLACSGKREAPVADCEGLVAHLVEVQTRTIGDLPQRLQSPLRDAIPAYRTAVLDSCTKSAWPHDAVACVTAATSGTAAEACGVHFRPEQQKQLLDAYTHLVDGSKQEATRWIGELTALIDKLCACSDAACRATAKRDFDAAAVDARLTRNADFKKALGLLDRKIADCAQTDCDEVSCVLDGSTPCCQRLAKSKPK